MLLLAIDTSTRYAGVAVLNGSRASEHTWRSEQNHGRELMPAINTVFDAAGARASEITHLAVALGPGGFSALRVGISMAIGISLPKDLPAVGVSTFDLESAPWASKATPESPLYALIPAGRTDVYWARYTGGPEPVETGVASPAGLAALVPDGARFCGEAAPLMSGHLPSAVLLSGPPPTRQPLTLARLAGVKIEAGLAKPAADLRPYYLREPAITAPRNR